MEVGITLPLFLFSTNFSIFVDKIFFSSNVQNSRKKWKMTNKFLGSEVLKKHIFVADHKNPFYCWHVTVDGMSILDIINGPRTSGAEIWPARNMKQSMMAPFVWQSYFSNLTYL